MSVLRRGKLRLRISSAMGSENEKHRRREKHEISKRAESEGSEAVPCPIELMKKQRA